MKSSLIKKLDILWSKQIRSRAPHCQRHVSSGHCIKLDAHHVIHRSIMITRWDIENGVALGAWCHRWHDDSAESNKKGFERWFKRLYPEKWKYIMAQKKKRFQFKDFHYEIVKKALEEGANLCDRLES